MPSEFAGQPSKTTLGRGPEQEQPTQARPTTRGASDRGIFEGLKEVGGPFECFMAISVVGCG